jgi:four helix bundle protein
MEKLFTKIEDLEVWKKGCRLTVDIYKLTGEGKFEKDWGFRDQLRRASLSIPSNVAVGYERKSVKEFKHFLNIALGSCAELRTQLYIAHAVEYITKDQMNNMVEKCLELSAQISKLSKNLKTSKSK